MNAKPRRMAPTGSSGGLGEAVEQTIAELSLGPRDAALAQLARSLAASIDGMDADVRERMLAQTSGQLLAVLRELHARAGGSAGSGGGPVPSKLQALREARVRREKRP